MRAALGVKQPTSRAEGELFLLRYWTHHVPCSELASTSLPPRPVTGQNEGLPSGDTYRKHAEDLLLHTSFMGRAAPERISGLVTALRKVTPSPGANLGAGWRSRGLETPSLPGQLGDELQISLVNWNHMREVEREDWCLWRSPGKDPEALGCYFRFPFREGLVEGQTWNSASSIRL